ncbi:uncharacterized protein LOC111493741 isoform X1 [Cucurbita maxima]|uniref:Uncharacterized protein LOC111493741 isoform X1 n=1 Tax=Cucurbita maxima TaxID=3661 RepID=A0A6J1KGR5_CUCMA|nr:uncharacterized protein LOC111493741 isoform X1 [Cucurbita maxima]
MAAASRGRVTITLGRSGQVVKKASPGTDVSVSDSWPVSGTKRSVRDRLGSSSDSDGLYGSQLDNKRLRGDDGMSNWSSNGLDVPHSHIGKDDLRYKLLQKDAFRRALSDNKKCLDLRERLPKADQAPIRHLDSRYHDPPLPNTKILRRTPSMRSADDLSQKDSLGSSYSSWTMDNLRQRSPARVVEPSRRYSLQRDDEKLQRRTTYSSVENARSVGYVAKDIHNASGSVSTATFMTNSLLPPTSAKPVAPVAPLHPPPSGIAHKTLYPGDELQSIDGLLQSLGLGKYSILFKAEEVDMTALKQMGENDLKELGIPMGPRKKILLAISPRSKRQP